MAWGAVAGATIGAVGAYASSKNNKAAAQAGSQQKIDPRLQQLLFGSADENAPLSGLLGQYQGMFTGPQADAAKNYASTNADYLAQYGGKDLAAIRDAGNTLLSRGVSAPMIGAAQTPLSAYAVGNMVDAPAQNNIDLTGTFKTLLGGGDTSALMSSLKAGNALTNEQLAQNQANLTDNLKRNVLPALQGGAIAAGQYGSSRQGIAEGNAVSDFTKQLNDSATQIGLANSANTAGQLANSYESGQSRALAAAQGLSQQQYTKALQDAATKNQAEFMNVGNTLDVDKTNAGLTQQTNLANQNSLQQTNSLNTAGLTAGSGILGGLLTQTGNGLNAGTNYAQGVNNLITPYLGANQTTTQPYYQSTSGSVLGGALAGSQLGSLFNGRSGSGSVNNTLF